MTIASQYRASLKHPEAEEILDLILFRPIAFLLVKVLLPLPVTPNQITVGAMIAGVIGGCFYATGSHAGFLWGAIFYALCNVLDCADGMVARLKGNGTRIGRIIDIFVDLIAGSAVFLGLGIGLSTAGTGLPFNAWLLVVLAAISYAIHSSLFDEYRNRYMARGLGRIASLEEEIASMTEELNRLESAGEGTWQRTLIRLYLGYSRFQLKGERGDGGAGASRDYAGRNRLALRLWSVIGSTSHVTILVLASLLGRPMIFFWFVIVFANIWTLLLWIYQKHLDRSLPEPNAELMLRQSEAEERPIRPSLAGEPFHLDTEPS
jgi:phosphatidylglycerophosphate synthase